MLVIAVVKASFLIAVSEVIGSSSVGRVGGGGNVVWVHGGRGSGGGGGFECWRRWC